MAAEYAKAAGGNYKLSGCASTGSSSVAPGTLVINGEILPFKGGTVQSMVRIIESKKSLTAGSETYDAYTERTVEFGSNVNGVDNYAWSSFSQFPTNKFLLENSATKAELETLKTLAMPKGAIIMWSGAEHTIPTGFSLCNGSNGTPDLRGRFVVGYFPGKSNTPVVTDTTENYGAVGNTGGQLAVTLSVNQIPSHTHTVRTGGDSSTDHNTNDYLHGQNPDNRVGTYVTSATGGGQSHENRPPYYVLAFIMKTV